MFRLLALALSLLAAGCAGPASVAPASAVQAYLAAGAHDDPHAAYLLLSQAARSSLSEEDFAARWRTSAGERKAQAAELTPLVGRPATEHARALWSDGREAELVRAPPGWRLRVAAGGRGWGRQPRGGGPPLRRGVGASHDLDGFLDLAGRSAARPVRARARRAASRGSKPRSIRISRSRGRARASASTSATTSSCAWKTAAGESPISTSWPQSAHGRSSLPAIEVVATTIQFALRLGDWPAHSASPAGDSCTVAINLRRSSVIWRWAIYATR